MTEKNQPATLERKMFYPPVEEEWGFSMTARAGQTLYVSGMIGHDQGVMHDDPARQYELAYRNIAEVLATHGATLDNVAMERAYMTPRMAELDPAVQRRIRGEVYGTSFPATTSVMVERIMVPGALIEIEVVVILP